jgi:hypothetical protein
MGHGAAKKKEFDAVFLTNRFADGIEANGPPISEDERKLARNLIISAADFHMMPKDQQEKMLRQCTDGQAAPFDLEVAQ